jgi:rhodanese-related sulfurtransferase
MNIRYVFFAVLLLILGGGLFFLPEKQNQYEKQPQQLLSELYDQTRYVSTDEVAERIINQDPALFLVDVRMADYYEEYSLPGAMNIPFEDILNPDWEEYLNQEYVDIVFYSNSDVYAEQAWMLANRKGFENLYIMKGGLNCWFETIIKPAKPLVTASNTEFDLYEFRKGARQYFSGASLSIEENTGTEPVVIKRKKKNAVIEGGC